MNIWILVFARILDYTGWMAGLVFLDFSLVFLGSLDQVFLLDIGVLVSINLNVYKHIVKI